MKLLHHNEASFLPEWCSLIDWQPLNLSQAVSLSDAIDKNLLLFYHTVDSPQALISVNR